MNIYIYEIESKKGYYKLGQTHRNVEDRIREQVGHLPIKYSILFKERIDGVTDYDIMAELKSHGITSDYRNEWYTCKLETILKAIETCKSRVNKNSMETSSPIIEILLALYYTEVSLSKNKFLFSIISSPFNFLKELKRTKGRYISIEREVALVQKDFLNNLFNCFMRRKTNLLALLFISFLIFTCIITLLLC